MQTINYIALIATLVQTALAAAQNAKTNAEVQIAQDVLDNLQAALNGLLAVEGTDVTYQQLEGLRTKATW